VVQTLPPLIGYDEASATVEIRPLQCAGINRHEAEDERACAAMLADVPVGESPIGGNAQVPP
jgi:hypothetical protein